MLKPDALMAVFDGTWYAKGWKQSDYVSKMRHRHKPPYESDLRD